MISRIEPALRRLRRSFSRTEWFARLWRFPPIVSDKNRTGLVMVQVDGLSLYELRRAMDQGRLPFMRRLFRREHYALYPMYSGLPASTPAIQAELFYGVRSAVPSFEYFDRTLGRMVRMYNAEDAVEIERRLSKQSAGLLEGGSAYSDIFTGGAAEPHFCASSVGWNGRIRARGLFSTLLLLVRVGLSPRGLGLLFIEFILAAASAFSGVVRGQNVWKETKFVLARLAVCILLREYVTFGAMIDIARGVPVIHLNLLGYDEQAHRRGPSSLFARWALKGIDRAVCEIWKSAHRSVRRHYDVWIYSDHGQEECLPYAAVEGESFSSVAGRIVAGLKFPAADANLSESHSAGRARLLGGKWFQRLFRQKHSAPAGEKKFFVSGMGPVGHLNLWPRPDAHTRNLLAQEFVMKGHVPVVLSVGHPGAAHAWTSKGRLDLPAQIKQLFPDHPFLTELEKDLTALVHHPHAGDLVMLGWRPGKKTIALSNENGTHGGPGFLETEAFALLPADTALPSGKRAFLRPWDLRQAALHILGKPTELMPVRTVPVRSPGIFRVMTYNIHSCRGMDGRLSVDRVARVIARVHPDLAALQELDVGRKRSGHADQIAELADRLKMRHYFFPTVRQEHEQYGDAILSRHPMRLVRQGRLPGPPDFQDPEWRGALWVSVRLCGRDINFFNTHLSFSPKKSRLQASALMGEDWLGHPDCVPPAILCGDMNALPQSAVCRTFKSALHDVQLRSAGHRPKKTWFSRFPIGRIDHIFVSEDFQVKAVEVPSTELEKQVSDHFPLIADLEFSRTPAAEKICASKFAGATPHEARTTA